MKTLYLLRHGEAQSSGYEDFDRPLTDHGKATIEKVGKQLASGTQPDLVIYSPAMRTLETKEIVAQHLDKKTQYIEYKNLYAAPVQDIFNMIQSIDYNYQSLLIIAHNPGLSDLTSEFNPMSPSILSPGELVQFTIGTSA
jgi:phosphohistidine phosphatase